MFRNGNCVLMLATAATLAAVPLGKSASAAILNDVADGQLIDPATWGGSTPAVGDTLNVDSNTVSTSNANEGLVPDDLTVNLSGDGTNGKLLFSYDVDITQSGNLNFLGGGSVDHSRGNLWSGGLNWDVAGTTTYHNGSFTEYSRLGGNGATTSTVMTGSGTIIKTGSGNFGIRSIVNATDGDSITPGNQPRINASTFSGTYDVQAGLLEPEVPEFVKYATVNLGGTVAGTIAGTNSAAGLEDSPRLNYANGGTIALSQLEVKNLTGTGRVSWNNTTGYYRDVAIGTLIDPGSSTEAGLIKRHTASGSNDLVMRPGSTMAFDIFGATAADADQIDWTSSTGVSGMVFDEANLVVRLFEPSESTGLLSWILVNGDEWILKSSQDNSTAPISTDPQSFASISLQDLSGDPLNIYTGLGDIDGGWDFTSSGYGVNSNAGGAGNRQVVLTGEYFAPIPEPTTLSVLAIAGLGVLRRRRAGK